MKVPEWTCKDPNENRFDFDLETKTETKVDYQGWAKETLTL